MIIEKIKWREIRLRHLTDKSDFYKTEVMDEAYISLDGNRLDVWELNSISFNRSWLYMKPKITKLTTNEIEIDAEWWGSKFSSDGSVENYPNHKVKITAKF